MLNAFRHHGVYRPERVAMLRSMSTECSTPFGITEYIGRQPRALSPGRRAIVLNAFRHHGVYR